MRKSPQPLTNFGQGYYISNQLGRRNLNPNQIAYLRGKRYETEKKISTDNLMVGTTPPKYQFDNSGKSPKTNENLAKEYGVASSTISRSANFAKVVDILPTETKNIVLSGAEKISHADTSTILKMDKPTQKKFIKEKNGITFLTIWRLNFEP